MVRSFPGGPDSLDGPSEAHHTDFQAENFRVAFKHYHSMEEFELRIL